MSLVKVTKSIRIEDSVLDKIEAAQTLLDQICEDLDEIVQEDDHYSFLLESGVRASANIQTFLDAYAERDL